MTSIGAVSVASGGLLGSSYAEEGKPQEELNASNSPTEKNVELLFLGTGAADWSRRYPPSTRQLARGEVRGMSSMLVNGQILIDCGPTVLAAMDRYGLNPADITDILMTHTHSDHFNKGTLLTIADARRDANRAPLRVWAHPVALKQVPTSDRIETSPVVIGQTFTIDGLGMTGLESNHHVDGSEEECLIYLIEGAATSVLYATDSAWLLTSTWRYLQKKKLDAIIWDATVGERKGDYRIFEHNDLTMIRHMNKTLARKKVLKPDAKIILTHMARTLHPSHEELEKKLLPEGLIPAYDGMSVVLE